jgi:hypothetical protein
METGSMRLRSGGHRPGTGILISTSMAYMIELSDMETRRIRFLLGTGMVMGAMESQSSVHQPGTGISTTILTEQWM